MAGQGTVLPDEHAVEGRDRISRINRLLYGLDTMDEASLKREMRTYSVAETVISRYFEKL